jgi:hypothetical protein
MTTAPMEKSTSRNIQTGSQKRFDAPAVSQLIAKLRAIAVHSLARMYRPEASLFAFRLRKNGQGELLEGASRRYTAIALIGLAGEDKDVASEVLGRQTCEALCGGLIDELENSEELGDVALAAWAARVLQHRRAKRVLDILWRMDPARRAYPTIEISWALTALVIAGSEITDFGLAEQIATRLMKLFRNDSGVFAQGPSRKGLAVLASHVSCFADFVYPIQALSHYYQLTGDTAARETICRCAERMCQLQGPQGQWWWHYDVRTGRVVERYPVYSVHQDSMAPMALFAAGRACGRDYSDSILKGLTWLTAPAEIEAALLDAERNVIWRKVARREPRKLVRSLQAAASRLHPGLRMPADDLFFPPVAIDHETRPYHMAWILHAWPPNHQYSDT